MMNVPTPIQHALVAKMLQGAVLPQKNPYLLQQGGSFISADP
jgi:hypothetical protein